VTALPLRVGVLVVALATSAHAAAPEAAASRYALAWVRDEGAESCPAGRDFAEEVSRRLGRSPFDQQAERTIEIQVRRDAGTYTSRVYVREQNGHVLGQRTLASGEDCAVLFSATALAVALLIDPDATLHANVNAGEAVAQFETPPPPTIPAEPPKPASTAVAAPPPPLPARREPEFVPMPRVPPEVASIALHGVLALDLVPGAKPGLELAASARLSHRLSVNAAASYAAPGDVTHEGTSFAVGLTALSLSAAYDFVNDGTVSAGAEAGAWLGVLRASLRSTTDESVVAKDAGDLPFLAASAGLGLRVHATHALFVEARALALVPLVGRKLELASNRGAPVSVWTQPGLGAFGAAGVGVSFF
jgi:hypothetical protein